MSEAKRKQKWNSNPAMVLSLVLFHTLKLCSEFWFCHNFFWKEVEIVVMNYWVSKSQLVCCVADFVLIHISFMIQKEFTDQDCFKKDSDPLGSIWEIWWSNGKRSSRGWELKHYFCFLWCTILSPYLRIVSLSQRKSSMFHHSDLKQQKIRVKIKPPEEHNRFIIEQDDWGLIYLSKLFLIITSIDKLKAEWKSTNEVGFRDQGQGWGM